MAIFLFMFCMLVTLLGSFKCTQDVPFVKSVMCLWQEQT